MNHPDFRPGTWSGSERYEWDAELKLSGIRLGRRSRDNGESDYVLGIDDSQGSRLLSLGTASAEGFSPELRLLAFEQLASLDPDPTRHAFWATRARCRRAIAPAAFYDQVAALSIVFGPNFRAVREIWRGDGEAIGRVELGRAMHGETPAYIHHPVFLDACLQLFGATLFDEASRKTFLPVGMESFRFEPGPVSAAWSHVRLRQAIAIADTTALADLTFYDLQGRPIGEICGFSLRLSDRSQLMEQGARLGGPASYHLSWEAQDLRPSQSPHALAAILGGGKLAEALRQQLEVGQTLPSGAEAAAIVVDSSQPLAAASLLDSARQLRQAVAQLGLDQPEARLRQLWFITRSAQQVSGHDSIRPQQALIWGFAQSLAREYPQLRVHCLDEADEHAGQAAATEIRGGSVETLVAWRGRQRYVARLAPLVTPAVSALPAGSPFTLRTSAYGSLDNLYLAACERSEPAAGEIEIRVHATGLNFKDVLHALGMLAEGGQQSGVGSAASMLFGGDCAGVVSRVGAGVTSVAVGDSVVATMAFGCFGSHVVVGEHFVAPLPSGLGFHEGAAIPTAYLTAFHALMRCGGLRAGDHVLIHAAAGGVGLAATQLALRFGAVVYATASQSKHAFLRSLGVQQVYDSRSLDFAEAIGQQRPQGLQLVLNSLNGEFIERSLALLAQGGRFVEIGKIGAWTAPQMAAARPDVGYSLFDLMDVAAEQPQLLADEFRAVLKLMSDDGLRPTRVQTFPIERVSDAFRCMAEARHIGKIVVTQPTHEQTRTVRPDRCHVIVGGLGALGRQLLGWLVAQGARQIALISRRQPDAALCQQLQTGLAQGASLRFVSADMADRQQAITALEQIASEGLPLGDIYHLAGVLADGLVRNQTDASFATVLQSKAEVALNLHLASQRLAHDRLILFSSIASVFGSAGQSNYAATNAVVDALAHYRRQLGLHGLSINWGPWASSGMAAELDAADQARLADAGVQALQADEAFDLMRQLLVSEQTQAVVADIDWSRAAAAFPPGQMPPWLAPLLGGHGSHEDIGNVLEDLRTLQGEAQWQAMTAAVCRCLAQVLRLAGSDIQPEQTLGELGLDSLMGVELRHKLEKLIGASVPIATLVRSPSVGELATELLQRAGLGSGSSQCSGDGAALLRLGGPSAAPARLICFHHLGGSAEFFRRWAEPLYEQYEVYAVQLPGRGQRSEEGYATDFDSLLHSLLPTLAALGDKPRVLYGHSMGSHLAFESARRLAMQGAAPQHLVLSGLWAPHDHSAEKHSDFLRDSGWNELEIPAALQQDASYMQSLQKLIEADARLLQSYGGVTADSSLPIPLTLFSGLDDAIAPPDKVARWAELCRERFEHHRLPGRHMFIIAQQTALLAALRQALQGCVSCET
ncbi:alpha/beta fold hydrolase [Parachitinimonas caeni]|uniref:SDR family NAD(P)-dependent oxidoreductase n=1 Tax=Parachitinimonas caeni TaxID=3031301 RepID=A0ABT7DRQ8_9NEIS|nr:alpha/beta fold hydrolase [Parachitinimonas caeni]MDK2122751.1 SDR family NAD(P)-dependent oxidoreductase [Parachitinimonas caeni]